MQRQAGKLPEIEVGPETVLIRRAVPQAAVADVMNMTYQLLTEIADQLSAARSPWDRNDVDGEDAFFAMTAEIADAIRSAVGRRQRSQIDPQDDSVG